MDSKVKARMEQRSFFTLFSIRIRSGLGSDERGFTLLEMLMVIVILSVAILGMEAVQIYAVAQIQRSDDTGTSASLAQDVMENLRNLPFDDVATGWLGHPIADNAEYSVTQTTGEKGRGTSLYFISWEVRAAPSGSSMEKVVDVRVRWTSQGFADTSIDLTDPTVDVKNVPGLREFVVTSIISDPGN
ncbi:prepilin-type N-terminal cleavage/methylation domain-containing protein [candidate division CSSED10-310 bacterium]|uniref:Prepilin-type N-terminal cleavage/methylation domain-containing protein n=1 Tax=candidate division CSSED10-310 bacterium TaxID=2855610 RepID=A0ABV6Z611_UNCC1